MSMDLEAWSKLNDPAELFLTLWAHVNSQKVRRADLSAELAANSAIIDALDAALEDDVAADAVKGVCAALRANWTDQVGESGRRTRAGLFLAAMRAIDRAIERIHPRTLLSPPGSGAPPLPNWLRQARDRRLAKGNYASLGARILIGRGPFARNPRGPDETGTFSLKDQFAACAVAPNVLEEDGRPISIEVRVIGQGVAKGVPPAKDRLGNETITLAPLAEATDDLVAKIVEDGGTHFIDIEKGAAFDPQGLFAKLLAECGNSDVLVLPELVIDEADAEAMRDKLATVSGDRPRLVVTGSGMMPNAPERPWNATEILNGSGAPLWAHRKNAAYSMMKDTFDNLELAGVGTATKLMERISWSDEIIVADIEGFGRCVVLICQDLMMSLVEELLKYFEPDWLFLPILDSGTNFKRWPFKRLVKLSEIGPTRFIVVSSITMLHWRKTSFPGEQIGVAVGPQTIAKAEMGADAPGKAKEIDCESPTRRHGTIRWNQGRWSKVESPAAS